MSKNVQSNKNKKQIQADQNILPKWLREVLNPELKSYERFPMLEVIFERVTRTLYANLRNFTSDNVEVILQEVGYLRFGEHLDKISDKSLIGIFTSQTWDGPGLVIADEALVFSMINVFLGGRTNLLPHSFESKTYTTIERNLTKLFFELVLGELESALEPLSPNKFFIESIENSQRFATIVRPSNASVLIRLKIHMEGKGGVMEFLIPYSSIDSIRPMLVELFVGDKIGHDTLWEKHVSKELLQTDVTLDAVLDEVNFALGDVLNWRKGTLIPLNITPESQITLCCDQISLFIGKMGQKSGKLAVFLDANYLNYQKGKDND